jgi:CheY-like chemotaxis protein
LSCKGRLVTATGADPVVLIVDDERDAAETYALRLRDGYETRVAYDGELDDDVDTVLLDRGMPISTGTTSSPGCVTAGSTDLSSW